jgi:hypothetical protein
MPTTTAAAVPPIVQWFQLYGNIIFFFGQLLWWIVTGFAAGWAACTYYRFFKMKRAGAAAHAEAAGKTAMAGSAPSDKAKADKKAAAKDVDVDKFVE